MPRLLPALVLLSLPLFAQQPVRILAVGDSLTEEYAFELPFSAPDSEPGDANIRNWPELFRIFRAGEASLGPYEGTASSYFDFRNGGHEWNFGVPSFTTADWIAVILKDSYNPLSDNAKEGLQYRTREALIEQLFAVQVAVIFLGGNDLKQDYSELFNDTEPADFFDRILQRLENLHAFLRNRRPLLPIVVCTLPDVGTTPHINLTYSDPQKAASTRMKIADFNARVVSTFEAKSKTTVARIDRITDLIFDRDPFHINGTVFTLAGDPENPPDHLFARDSFHPATAAQALIANEIIEAINAHGLGPIIPFAHRELLTFTGLNPDGPFLDWIATYDVSAQGFDADPDLDGLENGVEMGLGTRPDRFSSPVSGTWAPGGSLGWSPDPVALRYLDLTAMESATLANWSPVPPERLSSDGATVSASPPPGAEKSFVRLKAVPKP